MKIISRIINCSNLSSKDFTLKKENILKEVHEYASTLGLEFKEIREIFYSGSVDDPAYTKVAKNLAEANSYYEIPLFRIDYFYK